MEELADDTAQLGLGQADPDDYWLLDNPLGQVSQNTNRGASQPAIVGNKRLTDITQSFFEAAKGLPSGRLVKDETFTLFESVSALEIMDPKMDSGFLAPGETLHDDYDVLQDLLPEEVLWIMDELLCYEMAWHQGYPLSQTLFTSQYIENLLWPESSSLSEVDFHGETGSKPDYERTPMLLVLKTYCLGLIKCCDLVIQTVISSQLFEEEDFSTHTFNRELLTRYSTKDICDMLTVAEGFAGKSGAMGICSRMHVRLDLLTQFEPTPLPSYIADSMLLSDLPQKYADIGATHSSGFPKPEAFSQKIQRKLTSTVPPRPIVAISFQEAMSQLLRLRQELEQNSRVQRVLDSNSSQALQTFLFAFAAVRPEPLPFSRSRISDALMNRPDEWFAQLLKNDLALTVFPSNEVIDPVNWTLETPLNPAATPSSRYELARIIDNFVAKALPDVGGYLDYWSALSSNRCRFRRVLTHVLLGLDDLQRVADELDPRIENLVENSQELLPEALYQWTSLIKLRVSSWVVQLGFELDFYLPEELAGMYWLLSTISRRCVAVAKTILDFHEGVLDNLNPTGPDAARKQAQTARSIAYLKAQLLLSQGTESLAEALYSVYTYLHYFHLCPDPESTQRYHDPALQYELRMKPFLTLQERYMDLFDEYNRALHPFGRYSEPDCSMYEKSRLNGICDIANSSIRGARDSFQALKQMGAGAANVAVVEKEWAAVSILI